MIYFPFIQQSSIQTNNNQPLQGRLHVYLVGSNTYANVYTYTNNEYVPARNPIYTTVHGYVEPQFFCESQLVKIRQERYIGWNDDPSTDTDPTHWEFDREYYYSFTSNQEYGTLSSVTNVTELGSADVDDGTIMSVTGYYNDHDVEPRYYYYDANDVHQPDGGIYIANANGGNWVLLYEGDTIPATYYGCIGTHNENLPAVLAQTRYNKVYFNSTFKNTSQVGYNTAHDIIADAGCQLTDETHVFNCNSLEVLGNCTTPIGNFLFNNQHTAYSNWFYSLERFLKCNAERLVFTYYQWWATHSTGMVLNSITVSDTVIVAETPNIEWRCSASALIRFENCSFEYSSSLSSYLVNQAYLGKVRYYKCKLNMAHHINTESIYMQDCIVDVPFGAMLETAEGDSNVYVWLGGTVNSLFYNGKYNLDGVKANGIVDSTNKLTTFYAKWFNNHNALVLSLSVNPNVDTVDCTDAPFTLGTDYNVRYIKNGHNLVGGIEPLSIDGDRVNNRTFINCVFNETLGEINGGSFVNCRFTGVPFVAKNQASFQYSSNFDNCVFEQAVGVHQETNVPYRTCTFNNCVFQAAVVVSGTVQCRTRFIGCRFEFTDVYDLTAGNVEFSHCVIMPMLRVSWAKIDNCDTNGIVVYRPLVSTLIINNRVADVTIENSNVAAFGVDVPQSEDDSLDRLHKWRLVMRNNVVGNYVRRGAGGGVIANMNRWNPFRSDRFYYVTDLKVGYADYKDTLLGLSRNNVTTGSNSIANIWTGSNGAASNTYIASHWKSIFAPFVDDLSWQIEEQDAVDKSDALTQQLGYLLNVQFTKGINSNDYRSILITRANLMAMD